MDSRNKTLPSERADWEEEDRENLTPKWEIPIILGVVASIAAWRAFRQGYSELPAWLRETFGHVVALCVMGIMVFPEVRWWFVAAFAVPGSLSIFAMGLTGAMEAMDPTGADDWFGEDSELWKRRAFFFATMSALIAPLAYLR